MSVTNAAAGLVRTPMGSRGVIDHVGGARRPQPRRRQWRRDVPRQRRPCRERRASGHFGDQNSFGRVSCFTFRWVAVFRVSLSGRQRCFVFHFSPNACVSRVSCFSWTGGETPSGAKTCSLPAAVCCRSRPLVQLASPTNPRVRPHAAHHILTTPARPWPTVRVPQSGRIPHWA